MTLGHDVGSLNLASRVSGTVPTTRFGSLGSQRMYAGTLRASFSGGGYGSFGTTASRSLRVAMGSFRGSVGAHRLMGNYPAMRSTRAGKTGTYYGAPGRARFVSISTTCDPSATRIAGATLRQSLQGTVAAFEQAVNSTPITKWFVLRGWILPNRGSYAVVGTGLGGYDAVNGFWNEWDP